MKKSIALAVLFVSIVGSSYGMTYYLKKQWLEKGNRMCQYGNGTVLNIGIGLCPLSIEGN